MVIRRLKIKNFGKIRNRDMELIPGINVLYGENESGKTTTHTFIRSMFYGVRRLRGKAAQNDTYTKYEPWENPAEYGGIMWFTSKGKNYRLTRNFYKEKKMGELLCEDDGSLVDAEQGALESVLGNVSEAVYDNTVSVAQLKSVTGKDLVRELQNYMASYQGTGDSSVDMGRAMQMLKMSRKGFLVQQERRRRDEEGELQKLLTNVEHVQREMNTLKGNLDQIEEKENSLHMRPGDETGVAILDRKTERARKKRDFYTAGMILSAVLGIILLVAATVFTDSAVLELGILVIAALGVCGFGTGRMKGARELQKRGRMKAKWLSRQQELKKNREELQQEYCEREVLLGNLQEEYREYEDRICLTAREEIDIKALNLAMGVIKRYWGDAKSGSSSGAHGFGS